MLIQHQEYRGQLLSRPLPVNMDNDGVHCRVPSVEQSIRETGSRGLEWSGGACHTRPEGGACSRAVRIWAGWVKSNAR